MALDLVALKIAYDGLSFKDAVDVDALYEKLKERRGDAADGNATPEFLHSIFKDLGIEKEIEVPAAEGKEGGEGEEGGDGEGGDGEEGDAKEDAAAEEEAAPAAAAEEGGEEGEGKGDDAEGEGEGGEAAAEPEPPAPPPMTNYAGELFALLDPNNAGQIAIADLLSILNLLVKGYGEASLQFSTKAFDLADQGSLNEEELYSAIRWNASSELTPILRTHLRRLWRALPKSGSGADTRVKTEEFFENLGGDEFLAAVLLAEKQIELPAPEGGEEGEEEED